ncbi:MFS transporter [Streptomyces sp. NPDC095613]|uniref:MFS transporter n=1 Tax=Streptomyces sp. NPDC095613 TaxID=3155540 RepID=UPI00332F283B
MGSTRSTGETRTTEAATAETSLPGTRPRGGDGPGGDGPGGHGPRGRVPRVHRAWWVALAATLVIVAAGSFSTLSGALVGPLHGAFGWSRSTIGVAVSLNMVLYGLTAPFAAALMDRFGTRRTVPAALACLAAGGLLTTVMTAPWQFVLSWGLLVGLGSGALATTFAAVVAQRWFVRRRGLVTGVLTAAGVFGQFAFLPVLSWVVERHGWRPALMAVALAALVLLPPVRLLMADRPADAGTRPYGAGSRPYGAEEGDGEDAARPVPVRGAARRTVRVLLDAARTSGFWLLAGVFAVCGASTNGVMWSSFTPAAHDHGMPATAASSVLALIGVCNVAGTVGSGWLTDRFDPRRLLAGYFVLRGVSLVVLPFLMSATVRAPLVLFAVFFGLLDVATVPPVIALCREFHGDDSAIVFGWVSAAHQVGAGLMAGAGGVVRDTFGSYDPVWAGSGALCAAAALLALVVRRRPGRKPSCPQGRRAVGAGR